MAKRLTAKTVALAMDVQVRALFRPLLSRRQIGIIVLQTRKSDA